MNRVTDAERLPDVSPDKRVIGEVKNSRIAVSKMPAGIGIRVHLRPKLCSLWVKLRVGSQ